MTTSPKLQNKSKASPNTLIATLKNIKAVNTINNNCETHRVPPRSQLPVPLVSHNVAPPTRHFTHPQCDVSPIFPKAGPDGGV